MNINAQKSIRKDISVSLYSDMLRLRVIEEELARRYADWEMRCPVHFSIGQEAVPVAVCQCLERSDTVMSNHRSHGHYLAAGGSLKGMVAEIYGRETGCSRGKGGSMHLIDKKANFLGSASVVSDTIPIAVGVAFANKLNRRKAVSVVFFGDGATEEGLFYESLNFASLHRLPVFFICENNLYSVNSPVKVRQPESRQTYKLARSMGVRSMRVNGNDVEAVYKSAVFALKDIRSGSGPFLLEAMTYRHLEHCGPFCDVGTGYRTQDEFMKWKRKDPVAAYEKKLLKKGVISGEFTALLREEFTGEVTEAISFARSSPYPHRQNLLKDVYAQ